MITQNKELLGIAIDEVEFFSGLRARHLGNYKLRDMCKEIITKAREEVDKLGEETREYAHLANCAPRNQGAELDKRIEAPLDEADGSL